LFLKGRDRLMGRSYRSRPKKLGAKLKLIRLRLGLTQPEMIKELAVKAEPLYPSGISEYERGKREPSLLVLLKYARLAGVSTDVLIDDKLKLPDK
jgi:transcriptional regulator with XRE-family HTH domain